MRGGISERKIASFPQATRYETSPTPTSLARAGSGRRRPGGGQLDPHRLADLLPIADGLIELAQKNGQF